MLAMHQNLCLKKIRIPGQREKETEGKHGGGGAASYPSSPVLQEIAYSEKLHWFQS